MVEAMLDLVKDETENVTWRTGIEVLRAKKEASKHDVQDGLTMTLDGIPRVPGVALFFSSTRHGCPGAGSRISIAVPHR